jgi:hypothetical protein
VKWDGFLESCSKDNEKTLNTTVVNHKKAASKQLLISTTLDEFGGMAEEEELSEVFLPKYLYGFEIVLMMLLDEEHPKDRRTRKALLNPLLTEVAIV